MLKIEQKRESESEVREEIYAFGDEGVLPLRIVMAGITYPDLNYRIERKRELNHIFVFEYVIEGRGHLVIDGKRFEVSAGDTYILTPNTQQCYYADKNEPFKKIWINASSNYLSAVLEAHGISYGAYRYNSHSLMGEILEIAKSGGDAATVSAKIAPILLSLIEALCPYYKERKAESPALTAKERIDTLGGAAPFSPSALAEEMHISLSTLTRIFQSAYGCTPYEYHLSHKEKIAKSLLENTSLSAKEIAYRLGFSDAHYFSNFFKKRTGIRPAEYKKRNASH